MGTARPPEDAHAALLSSAQALLYAAEETGVVPAGACLIVAVGSADSAVMLTSGDARAAGLLLRTLAAKTPDILTTINKKTGN